jgi:hypothetical protein
LFLEMNEKRALSYLSLLHFGGAPDLEGLRGRHWVDELLKGVVVGLYVAHVVNQVLECQVRD